MKRAAAYIRVSNEEVELKGVSLENQRNEILKWADNNGYTIAENHIFKDNGKSGANQDREGLNALMAGAKRKEFDIVLVWKVDRFFRKTLFLLEYVEFLTGYGVHFKSITQDFETNTSSGRLVLGIFGVIGELERDLIRERTLAGKITKAKKGYYVAGGKTKFGYDFKRDNIGTKIAINEDEARVVRKIFDLYVKHKKTIGEIEKILVRDKEKTKDDRIMEQGGKTNKTVKGVWHRSVLGRILKSEMYTGHYYYGKTEKWRNPETGKEEIRKIPLEKLQPIECPAILKNKDIFYKAQELLEKNKKTRNNKKNHTFAGLIRCGKCGQSYTGYKTSKRTISYRCKGKRNDGKFYEKEKCKNNEVSEKYLINNIWKKIYSIFQSPDDAIEQYYKNTQGENNNITKLENKIKELKNKKSRIEEGLKKVIKEKFLADDENIYQEVYDELLNDKGRISKEIGDLEDKLFKAKDIEENRNNLYTFRKFFEGKIEKVSEEKKIEIIQELVEKITVEGNGDITVLFKFEGEDEDNGKWKRPKSDKKPFLENINTVEQKVNGVANKTIFK